MAELLSGSFGMSKGKQSSSTHENFAEGPPAWQMPYLQGGMNQARNLLNQGAYKGPYATGYNPALTQGQNTLGGLYGDQYGQVADQYSQAGQGLAGGMQSGYDYYSKMLQPGGGYLDQYKPATMLDPAIMQSAIYNPVIDQQIAAGGADINRQYDRNIAAMKAGATAGGGAGSSWRGLAQSDAMQGAGRDMANLSANLRGQAYGYGVDAANRGNAAINTAQFQDFSGRGTAANNLFDMGQQGMGYTGQGLNLRTQAGQGQVDLGTMQRQIEEEQRAGQERGYYAPWDVMQNYWNIVGQPLGSEGTRAGKSKGKSSSQSLKLGFKW